MKVTQYISILFLFISFGLFAQQTPPQGINYQAVALDFEKSEIPGINLEAKPLMNETITLRFTIIKDSETGATTYIETNEVDTDENGLFNTVIGQGDIDANSPQNFQDIDWGTGFHFLKVEIDIKQDGNFKDMGTNQLWSVPYSLYTKTAANGISSITDNGDGTLTFTYLDGSQYITPVLTGLTGPQGDQGPEGRNAYQIWLDQGNVGDTLTFLADIKGETGNGIITTVDNGDGTFTFTYDDGTIFTTSDLRGTNGSDGNGITSTTDNGDGTFTFTYDDGTTFTTSDLTGPQGPQGIQGPAGATGPAGSNGTNGTNGSDGNGIASTIDNGDGTFTLNYTDGTSFTTSDLTGPQGPQGIQGLQGIQGPAGTNGVNGTNGTNGSDGNGITSTTDNGDGTFTLNYTDGTSFTTSDLTGPQGPQGIQGLQGIQGPAGTNGVNGTNGTNGADGNGIASTTDNGDGTFTLTYTDGTSFTTSDLTGTQGPQGIQGPAGVNGTNGTNGTNGADGNGIASTTDNGDGTFTLNYTDGTSFTTSDLTGPQGQGGVTTAGSNVTISGAGTLGDPYVVNSTDNVDDADNDPSNELQTLSLSNDTLYLSNGNNVYLGGISGGGGFGVTNYPSWILNTGSCSDGTDFVSSGDTSFNRIMEFCNFHLQSGHTLTINDWLILRVSDTLRIDGIITGINSIDVGSGGGAGGYGGCWSSCPEGRKGSNSEISGYPYAYGGGQGYGSAGQDFPSNEINEALEFRGLYTGARGGRGYGGSNAIYSHAGGRGGAGLVISCGTLIFNGQIDVSGLNGGNSYRVGSSNIKASGGGGGGSVVIYTQNLDTNAGTVDVTGGAGGGGSYPAYSGGDGFYVLITP